METGLYFVSSEGPRVEGWSRSARVESLIPWTEYQLGVSAVNSAGEGGIAGVSQGQVCRTPPDVPGRSPLDVCTDSRKPRQLVIVWEVRLFIPGMICRRQLCRYCFYSRAVFLVFRPATIKVKFGTVRSSVPNFTLIGPGVGVTAPKTEKMELYQYNCP